MGSVLLLGSRLQSASDAITATGSSAGAHAAEAQASRPSMELETSAKLGLLGALGQLMIGDGSVDSRSSPTPTHLATAKSSNLTAGRPPHVPMSPTRHGSAAREDGSPVPQGGGWGGAKEAVRRASVDCLPVHGAAQASESIAPRQLSER